MLIDLDARIVQDRVAASLALPPLWRRYLALLAAAWLSTDERAGAELMSSPGWPGLDPLKAAEGRINTGIEPARGIFAAQLELGLPLIEIERAAFVKSERTRLSSTMGSWFFDEAAGLDTPFHGAPAPAPPPTPEGAEGAEPAIPPTPPSPSILPVELPSVMVPPGTPPPDPDILSLDELARLPTLTKRVLKLGTVSWMPLFPVQAGVAKRLALLARIHRKLIRETVCAAREFAELLDGHQRALAGEGASSPVIIIGAGGPS
jgi:hypothetical protein